MQRPNYDDVDAHGNDQWYFINTKHLIIVNFRKMFHVHEVGELSPQNVVEL